MQDEDKQINKRRKQIKRYKTSVNKRKAAKWDQIVRFNREIKNKSKSELLELEKNLNREIEQEKNRSVPSKENKVKLAIVRFEIMNR